MRKANCYQSQNAYLSLLGHDGVAGPGDLGLVHELAGLVLELLGAREEAVEFALVLGGLVGLLLELVLGPALLVPLAGAADVGLARLLGLRLDQALLFALRSLLCKL